MRGQEIFFVSCFRITQTQRAVSKRTLLPPLILRGGMVAIAFLLFFYTRTGQGREGGAISVHGSPLNTTREEPLDALGQFGKYERKVMRMFSLPFLTSSSKRTRHH